MQINGFVWDIAESNLRGVNMTETSNARVPRHPFQLLLVIVLALEAAALIAATIFLIFEVLVAPSDSFVSAIALTIVVAIASAWVVSIAVGAWRGQAWVRGASIVVQVLLAAIAIGSFQGIVPRADIGWVLLIPAVVVFLLVFSKPVQAALARKDV